MTYRVPEDLQSPENENTGIALGSRVLVPLGPRWTTGVIIAFHETTNIENVRAIAMCLDPYPAMPEGLLETCQWIAGYYVCSLSEVLSAALPAGIHTQSGQRIALGDTPADAHQLDARQKSIHDCIKENGPLSIIQLEKQVGTKIRGAIYELCRRNILRSVQKMNRPRTRAKMDRFVQLVQEDPEWMAAELPTIKRRAPKQAQCLTLLQGAGGSLPSRELSNQGIDSSVVRRLVDRKFLIVTEREVRRDPYEGETSAPPHNIKPTLQQTDALEQILADTDVPRYRTHLIQGVTGSGKTLIYIKTVARAIERGRGAIVLIPEISLTPQTVSRFRAHFGDQVAVLHSDLSDGERYDAWRNLREGLKRIAIGARSAIFAPVKNLGVIIVDEEHDSSYKQDNPAPRYNAKDVAVVRGKTEDVPVILGSATPSLESHLNAKTNKYNLIRMDERVDARPMPKVSVVDMKQESGLFSTALHKKILDRLSRKEGIILLLNRRGYAPYIQCSDCGEALRCSSCHVSLTLHGSATGGHLVCHYCAITTAMSRSCPTCQTGSLKVLGHGTQKVEEVIARQYPTARVIRMDADATSKKGSHARILNTFGRGDADILLGTQMVAKGLDYLHVTLVGVISADTGLNFPDFRAAERTFQLLTQVSGRAGRGDKPGEVIVQTYKPEEEAILYAQNHDFDAFTESEKPVRNQTGFPPYSRLALFLFKGVSEADVVQKAGQCADVLRSTGINGVEVLGPVQAPLSRLQGRYRWQVILRSPSHRALNQTIRLALDRFGGRSTRRSVMVDVDIDPVSML